MTEQLKSQPISEQQGLVEGKFDFLAGIFAVVSTLPEIIVIAEQFPYDFSEISQKAGWVSLIAEDESLAAEVHEAIVRGKQRAA